MSYIEKELERVTAALHGPLSPEDKRVMHAAQQALAWASDPCSFAAPHEYLEQGRRRYFNDTQEGDKQGNQVGGCDELTITGELERINEAIRVWPASNVDDGLTLKRLLDMRAALTWALRPLRYLPPLDYVAEAAKGMANSADQTP